MGGWGRGGRGREGGGEREREREVCGHHQQEGTQESLKVYKDVTHCYVR